MRKILSALLLLIVIGLGSLKNLQQKFRYNDENNSEKSSDEYGVVPTSYQTNCTCGTSNKNVTKIVRGRTTLVNEYPFMAGLVNLEINEIVCGGTIITKRHILTAAHCLALPLDFVNIHIGHHSYYEVKKSAKLLQPEMFIQHPHFNPLSVVYDVGIILLMENNTIVFNDNIRPICLPRRKIQPNGKTVKLLGWGRTGLNEYISNVLLKVYVNIKSLEICKESNPFVELMNRHQICTFTKGQDACEGDSGGPLLWVDKTNMYTLIGIISYGYGCALKPAVNSDINYFMPWIQSVIFDTDESAKTCLRVKQPKQKRP